MSEHLSTEVRWSEEDAGFIATCPELDGISAFGTTRTEALAELEVAIGLASEEYQEQGLDLPEAQLVLEYSGQFRLRLTKSLHGKLAQRAMAENVSLNTLVSTLLAEGVGAATARDGVTRRLETIIRRVEAVATSDTGQWQAVVQAAQSLQPVTFLTETQQEPLALQSPLSAEEELVHRSSLRKVA